MTTCDLKSFQPGQTPRLSKPKLTGEVDRGSLDGGQNAFDARPIIYGIIKSWKFGVVLQAWQHEDRVLDLVHPFLTPVFEVPLQQLQLLRVRVHFFRLLLAFQVVIDVERVLNLPV